MRCLKEAARRQRRRRLSLKCQLVSSFLEAARRPPQKRAGPKVDHFWRTRPPNGASFEPDDQPRECSHNASASRHLCVCICVCVCVCVCAFIFRAGFARSLARSTRERAPPAVLFDAERRKRAARSSSPGRCEMAVAGACNQIADFACHVSSLERVRQQSNKDVLLLLALACCDWPT